jgi:hypothetical protein
MPTATCRSIEPHLAWHERTHGDPAQRGMRERIHAQLIIDPDAIESPA